LAPNTFITVSKIPNCPAVKTPIITHLVDKPVKQSFANPISLAIVKRRETVPPLPPAPFLLILDNNVSAG
jgi:hypothetical protein